MLTGDQKLTAESIAKSCKMIINEYEVTDFDEESDSEKIAIKLEDLNRKCFFSKNKQALIIGTDDISIVLINSYLKDKVL
jgi:magnesium-transporting ATPase (P-type)